MKLDFTQIRKAGGLELLARQLVDGFMIGLHKSPYHGFSVEFAEHRLFNEGQSTRHIDWKVYARTDRLYTKQYEEETNLRCLLVLDASSSMFYPKEQPKMEFSIYAASALAWLLHKQRDAVGICLFSNVIEEMTSIKSSASHLNKIFARLENQLNAASQPKTTSIAPVLHEVAEKIHARSLVILFTDMFEGNENHLELLKALQHLKHNKHEVLIFQITHQSTELHFDFEERPYEFIDMETNEKITLHPRDVKDSLQEKLASRRRELVSRCQQLKIDLAEADSGGDFQEVLQAYLIKRARLN